MHVMSDCRYRARPGPILKWRFDLEINSRAILLPSADSSRVKHRGDRGWLMHFLVFRGYLVNGMTKYDYFCMC